MPKTIRITLEDSEHEEWSGVKGEKTWYDVLKKGVELVRGGDLK